MTVGYYHSGSSLKSAAQILEMIFPVQCLRCSQVHDAGKIVVIDRYLDCSTWRCPDCDSLIDSRPHYGGTYELNRDDLALLRDRANKSRYMFNGYDDEYYG